MSASALTLFGADGVKVHAAASVVQAHGVALTLVPWVEGATAPHTGLCEMHRICLSVICASTEAKI